MGGIKSGIIIRCKLLDRDQARSYSPVGVWEPEIDAALAKVQIEVALGGPEQH